MHDTKANFARVAAYPIELGGLCRSIRTGFVPDPSGADISRFGADYGTVGPFCFQEPHILWENVIKMAKKRAFPCRGLAAVPFIPFLPDNPPRLR